MNEKSPLTADDVRRKILKSGAALVPLAITLQSGTAWAVSACIDGVPVPEEDTVRAMLENPINQASIINATKLTVEDIQDILDDPYGLVSASRETYDIDRHVKSGEVLWMRLNGGASCWVSFCNEVDPGRGPGLGGVYGPHSEKVCGD